MTRTELHTHHNNLATEAREVSRLLGMSIGQAFRLVHSMDQASIATVPFGWSSIETSVEA